MRLVTIMFKCYTADEDSLPVNTGQSMLVNYYICLLSDKNSAQKFPGKKPPNRKSPFEMPIDKIQSPTKSPGKFALRTIKDF